MPLTARIAQKAEMPHGSTARSTELLLRLNVETACRRGGALALTLSKRVPREVATALSALTGEPHSLALNP